MIPTKPQSCRYQTGHDRDHQISIDIEARAISLSLARSLWRSDTYRSITIGVASLTTRRRRRWVVVGVEAPRQVVGVGVHLIPAATLRLALLLRDAREAAVDSIARVVARLSRHQRGHRYNDHHDEKRRRAGHWIGCLSVCLSRTLTPTHTT